MPDDNPKIIIDEGWKAQVQREREEAARKAAEEAARKAEEERALAQAAAPGGAAPVEAQLPEEDDYPDGEEGPLEANFITLVVSMATQAMFALGVMAPQGARQVMINLDQAKFTIDTLEMLGEKTQGNLTPEEDATLRESLTELQRIYMARVQQWQEQTLRESGIDPMNLKGGL